MKNIFEKWLRRRPFVQSILAENRMLKDKVARLIALNEEYREYHGRQMVGHGLRIRDLEQTISDQQKMNLALRQDNEKLHKFKDKYGEGMGFLHPDLKHLNES